MDSDHLHLSEDRFTDLQQQDLAIYTTSIAVFFVLLWLGMRNWAPAVSLAVQVLTMDVIGESP